MRLAHIKYLAQLRKLNKIYGNHLGIDFKASEELQREIWQGNYSRFQSTITMIVWAHRHGTAITRNDHEALIHTKNNLWFHVYLEDPFLEDPLATV